MAPSDSGIAKPTPKAVGAFMKPLHPSKELIEQMGQVEGDELDIVEAVRKVDRKAAFLKSMQRFAWPAFDDYKFDRDEANER
jgi:antitoxin MazE